VDRAFRVGPLRLGVRTTVVRLADGGVFLHCPVEMDASTVREIAAAGPVRFLVAANKLHYLFLKSACAAFPEAELHGAPGLAEKRRDLCFDATLGDAPPAAWSADLDQLHVRGIPRAEEVVFLHRASRTLLLTDLCFNVQHGDTLTRLFMRVNGAWKRFGPSRLLRSLVRDRRALGASLDRILAWDFDRVVVTHGDVLECGGREALRDAFAWLR
jgi:hypothetical protein